MHTISRTDIHENAIKVLYRLKKAGFEAYLVGGGVRDLLVGRKPKDFDVATDALPEEVRKIFRNCRLIGKRFRLAHVFFGRDIVEVATFRASTTAEEDKHIKGMILRDNVYGTIEEDAWRRDFTVNALYYNIRDFSLVDYCGGLADLKQKILRMIGEPRKRYHEDPVRLLRAIRLASKLGFTIHPDTAAPITELSELLEHVPPARIFEEIVKMFLTGHGQASFELLCNYGLFSRLFPQAIDFSSGEVPETTEALILQALKSTDERVQVDKPVTVAFIFTAILWFPVQKVVQQLKNSGLKESKALEQAIHTVLTKQIQQTAIPKRHLSMIHDIWVLQYSLAKRRIKQLEFITTHRRFRAAYDFLVLRAKVETHLVGLSQWWTDFQLADEATRLTMTQSLVKPASTKKRKRLPRAITK